mmetsp:Transcript_4260/g.3577  ORF Transcript_4260/g.3577 Transcript_4260/m.3577 type:complete len:110 (+) Transcript_4260:17-346(+)
MKSEKIKPQILIKSSREGYKYIWTEIKTDMNTFLSQKSNKILLTLGLSCVPFLYIVSRRKLMLFSKFPSNSYLKASMISRNMIESHKYIHLEFLKSLSITSSIDKISYK